MNNRRTSFPFLLLVVTLIHFGLLANESGAQIQKTIPLWEKGAPGAKGTEAKDRPQLMIQIPKNNNSTAIVILPGGGYGHLAMGHEGKEIANWFGKLGIATFICDYRHRGKGYSHPAPMLDAQRAIQLVRANAKEWGIATDKIGVIGFSAGGHLASTVSNHFDNSEADSEDPVSQMSSRPDFAILCYPVIAFGEPFTHKGSQNNLLGKNASKELIQKYSNEKQVTSKTPPTFLWSTADDGAVKVENSLRYFAALRKHKVAAALHVFPTGRHGLGMASKDKEVSEWTGLCEKWLTHRGFLPEKSENEK